MNEEIKKLKEEREQLTYDVSRLMCGADIFPEIRGRIRFFLDSLQDTSRLKNEAEVKELVSALVEIDKKSINTFELLAAQIKKKQVRINDLAGIPSY
jgi:hypothetical protein